MKENKLKKVLSLLILLIILFFLMFHPDLSVNVSAQDSNDQRLQELNNEIKKYEEEIKKLKSQATTLSNQIAQYDAQIRLTTLKINQTEEKIFILGGRIDQLAVSLDSLSKAFTTRVVYSYKLSRVHEPLMMLITSPDLSSAFSSYRYLQKIQEADRSLLIRLQNAQVSYEGEKKNQEGLQKELESQKKVLGTQKAAKATLLEQTRNNEKKYQELLASAKAEFEAIQAIVSGKGQETKVGHVNQGDKIASIIQGPSCNSSGGHLHFIVKQGNSTQNPFSYLKSGISAENCTGSSCGSSDGDPFNPSGSWDWPISPTIKYYQGYGSTWAVRNTWVGRVYSFHNGIDINSLSSPDIHSVKAGTLFRGSYSGVNGCRLRYVRVDHDDSDQDTLYLHVNY